MGEEGSTIEERQTIHYLGIPLKGTYDMYDHKPWTLYGSLGLTAEIPVSSTLVSDYYAKGQLRASDKVSFRAPCQWSATFGFGLQYHLTPNIGIFTEPSLQYFIPTHTDIETYRTVHSFSFSLPMGIKFSW
jgi:RNA polymerase sigma-70 factor (ECF subfamily)